MNYFTELLRLLVSAFTSAIIAYSIARYTTKKQLGIVRLPKLIELREKVIKLRELDPEVTKGIAREEMDSGVALAAITKIIKNFVEFQSVFPKYFPYFDNKIRVKIEKQIKNFKKETKIIAERAYKISELDDAMEGNEEVIDTFIEKMGIEPIEFLSHFGSLAVNSLEEIHNLINKNINRLR